MNGSLSIEPRGEGEITIVFTVAEKGDVDVLTLDLMTYCDDVLYEPGNRDGRYESCLLYNEKIDIKIRTQRRFLSCEVKDRIPYRIIEKKVGRIEWKTY